MLEPDPSRLAHALEIVLAGLEIFLATAFESDGSSTEGVGYWHYGLLNYITLAEMLFARTGGELNLLADERLINIAAFPAKLHITGDQYASFADCNPHERFHPGILMRLAERTGEQSLLGLVAAQPAPESDFRLSALLRDLLWWDGSRPPAQPLKDAVLPVSGIVRLVTTTSKGEPVVLIAKAGHNAENHNHNDIGSFIFNIDGEPFFTDPGRGLYTRDYFNDKRYENIFANSYGHSVPRIDGALQTEGAAYCGELVLETLESQGKYAVVDLTRAYNLPWLKSASRNFYLRTRNKRAEKCIFEIEGMFKFTQGEHSVEEAFVTWLPCTIDGHSAIIHGQRHELHLVISNPEGVHFTLEELVEQSKANQKDEILKRLSIFLPPRQEHVVCISMWILPKGK